MFQIADMNVAHDYMAILENIDDHPNVNNKDNPDHCPVHLLGDRPTNLLR